MTGRATFRHADLFRTDLAEASVITLFLLPEIDVKLRPRLLALAPGARHEVRVRGSAMGGSAITDGASTPWAATRGSGR